MKCNAYSKVHFTKMKYSLVFNDRALHHFSLARTLTSGSSLEAVVTNMGGFIPAKCAIQVNAIASVNHRVLQITATVA